MSLLNTRKKSIETIMESIYELALNLQFSMPENSRLFIFTSVNPIKEQPVLISHLAAAFAEQGKKVLLVDTNTELPALHTIFSIENTHGLSSLLLEDSIGISPFTTAIDNLYLLPVGPYTLSPVHFYTEKWERLVGEFRKEYDMVFFNAPPALRNPGDIRMLSETGDAIIFFVKQAKTKKKDTINTIGKLKKSRRDLFIGTIYLK